MIRLGLLFGSLWFMFFLLVSCHSIHYNSINKSVWSVPRSFLPRDENRWNQIENEIADTSSQRLTFLWEGGGGAIDIAQDFDNVILKKEQQGANIFFDVIGAAISAHATSACYSSEYRIEPGALLIFHPVFNQYLSKIVRHKVYANDQSTFSMCIEKGILSQSDVKEMVTKHERLEIDSRGSRTFKPDYVSYDYKDN